jgi:hypothetical protein
VAISNAEVRDAITDRFPQSEIRTTWIPPIVAIIGRLVTPEWHAFFPPSHGNFLALL